MSYSDAIADFIAFMEANGVVPVEPIAQRLSGGNLVRFRCEGDKKGRLNGWAILHLDGRPAGAFGNHRLNTGTLKWKASGDRPALSSEERKALTREWNEARERRDEERRRTQADAGMQAQRIWRTSPPANPDHAYLVKKGMEPIGIRQSGDWLLIPMRDATGSLWNLQRIGPDGAKRFLKNGRTTGLYWPIGAFTGTICIAEGAATAAAIHRATGHATAAAFSAANLEAVAMALRGKYAEVELIICGDDDDHLDRNVGLDAARKAALAAGGRLAIPKGAR